jgi:anti-sigma factor RsiW
VTCREFADFMLDYLAGELAADVGASFERHLTRCPSCVAYLAQYRATIVAGYEAFRDDDGEVPPDVPEELIEAILSSRRG